MKHTKVGFMSTELILVASKKGYKIKEIPINWKDTRKSKNSILRGIIDALINLFIIKKDLRLGRYN